MSEHERMALAARLRGDAPQGGHRFGPGLATQVYAVASGKGGVGKSTVTANLAVALAEQGKRVGVLDADVWGYSIPHLFGVRRAPVALKGLMLPVEAHGVALMSVGFFVDDDEPVVWRGPMLHKAIEQFLADVHWGELDVLLDRPARRAPATSPCRCSSCSPTPRCSRSPPRSRRRRRRRAGGPDGPQRADAGRRGRGEHVHAGLRLVRRAAPRCSAAAAGERLAEALDAPLLGQVPLDVDAARGRGRRRAGDVLRAAGATRPRSSDGSPPRLPVVRRSLVGRSLPLSVV